MSNPSRRSVAQTLPARLRDLREHSWNGRQVQQQELARALGVAKSTVSGWESPRSGKPPPRTEWLHKIATFFATDRSVGAMTTTGAPGQPHLVVDLDPLEEAVRNRLFAELVALADGGHTNADGGNILQFPAGEPVRIICGEVPRIEQAKSASTDHPNFVRLMSYADLDAIVEAYGHIRELNPGSDVQIRKSDKLSEDDPNSHLVIVGNLARAKDQDSRIGSVRLRVTQIDDPGIQYGEPFEYVDDDGKQHRYSPKLSHSRQGNPVTEDFGFLARRRNPINGHYTMTICSGVLTRGVYGTVRSLTDPNFRHTNQDYLTKHFADSRSFGLLIRVAVLNESVPTPDFRDPDCIVIVYSD